MHSPHEEVENVFETTVDAEITAPQVPSIPSIFSLPLLSPFIITTASNPLGQLSSLYPTTARPSPRPPRIPQFSQNRKITIARVDQVLAERPSHPHACMQCQGRLIPDRPIARSPRSGWENSTRERCTLPTPTLRRDCRVWTGERVRI